MTIDINSLYAPGTQVSEDVAGYIPVEIASHSTVYMVGSAAQGPEDEPTLVVSPEDFTNQFGASDSLDAVKLYFANNQGGYLMFVRVSAVDDEAPTATEYVATIGKAFEPEDRQGYLIAPQAFQGLTVASDRLAVANKMRDVASAPGYDWVALVDCGATIDTVAELTTEAATITSERGHVAYFAPYVIDLNDNLVPSSAAVAGIAVRRSREQGFYQPPAGTKYPVKGVKDVAVRYSQAQQEVLNPLGVNLTRNLRNAGVVVWGSRVKASSPYYKFLNTRVILNVLNGTLRGAFDSEIFSMVDGQGTLMARLRETANAICYRLYQAGALYGATPEASFGVVCDSRNNPNLDLEQGIVRLDVYVAPSPTLERLLIRTVRTPIGEVEVTVQAA